MTKKEIMKRLKVLEQWDQELIKKDVWTEEEEETANAIFTEMCGLLKKLREM